MNKLKQSPSKLTLGVFWFWTLLYYVIATVEIIQLASKSIGESKIFMIVITGFLLLIHIAIYLSIMVNNIVKRYFSKLELIACIGGVIISMVFFVVMKNNANITIRY